MYLTQVGGKRKGREEIDRSSQPLRQLLPYPAVSFRILCTRPDPKKYRLSPPTPVTPPSHQLLRHLSDLTLDLYITRSPHLVDDVFLDTRLSSEDVDFNGTLTTTTVQDGPPIDFRVPVLDPPRTHVIIECVRGFTWKNTNNGEPDVSSQESSPLDSEYTLCMTYSQKTRVFLTLRLRTDC